MIRLISKWHLTDGLLSGMTFHIASSRRLTFSWHWYNIFPFKWYLIEVDLNVSGMFFHVPWCQMLYFKKNGVVYKSISHLLSGIAKCCLHAFDSRYIKTYAPGKYRLWMLALMELCSTSQESCAYILGGHIGKCFPHYWPFVRRICLPLGGLSAQWVRPLNLFVSLNKLLYKQWNWYMPWCSCYVTVLNFFTWSAPFLSGTSQFHSYPSWLFLRHRHDMEWKKVQKGYPFLQNTTLVEPLVWVQQLFFIISSCQVCLSSHWQVICMSL